MTKFSRREVLRGGGIAAMAILAAACQPKVVEVTRVVEKEVEKVVRETVIVDEAAQKAAAMKGELRWAFRADIELPWVEERIKTFTEMYPNTSVKQVILARSDMYPKMYANARSRRSGGCVLFLPLSLSVVAGHRQRHPHGAGRLSGKRSTGPQ